MQAHPGRDGDQSHHDSTKEIKFQFQMSSLVKSAKQFWKK